MSAHSFAWSRRTVLTSAFAAAASTSTFAHGAGEHNGGPGRPPEKSLDTTPSDPLAGRFGGPFTLTDHTGQTISDTAWRGSFMLIYFGYTRCQDVCPVDLSVMAQALDELGQSADAIQPIFITVDPAHDTSARLAEFIKNFHPRLIALTGTEPEIAKVARAYKVHRRKVITDAAQPESFIVDHGSLTYLMGRDGAFLTLIPHTTSPERMREIIKRYLGGA